MWEKKICFVLGLVLITLSLFVGSVSANSGPPPAGVQFEFISGEKTIKVVGLQILGCMTDACTDVVLLQQYGICDAAECLTAPPLLDGDLDSIGCSLQCKATSTAYKGRPFRLVAQFADGARESDVVYRLPVKEMADFDSWDVQVMPDRLVVAPAEIESYAPFDLFLEIRLFFKSVLLTFGSELLVAALYFRLRLQYTKGMLFANLGMIFAIDLLTVPMVWLFFPNLLADPLGLVTFDLIMPILFVMAVAMYVWISRASNNNVKLILGVFTALLIPASCYVMAMVGAVELPAFLPSYEAVIVLAELFAFVAEAVLIYVLRKGEIVLGDAVVLSLLMNVTSFLLGLLFLDLAWW